MSEELFENLQLYFPTVARRTTSYEMSNDFELVVRTDDGEAYIYDDLDRTIRRIPENGGVDDETLWRQEFGRRLRKRMERKGYTQQELADEVGISQVMLSNFITGRSMPGFYIVDKLARALDCSIDNFRYV